MFYLLATFNQSEPDLFALISRPATVIIVFIILYQHQIVTVKGNRSHKKKIFHNVNTGRAHHNWVAYIFLGCQSWVCEWSEYLCMESTWNEYSNIFNLKIGSID